MNEEKLFTTLTGIAEKIGKLQSQGDTVKENIDKLTVKVDKMNNLKVEVGKNKERSKTNRRIVLLVLGGLLSAVLVRILTQ